MEASTGSSHHAAYRPDIDGLRAFAVLFVVLFHVFPESVQGGFVGVDVFFVISGFLIGGIILRGLSGGAFSFSRFYARRVLRIFPALSLVLLTVLAAGYFLLFDDEYEMLGKHVFGGTAFLSNLMYFAEAGYWDISSDLKPLLHLWSLGIEEQFYIVIPILLAFAWKRKWPVLPLIGGLFLVSFLWNIGIYRTQESFDFYMPMTRFWEIFIGVGLAALHPQEFPAPPRSRRMPAWTAMIGRRHAQCALTVLGVLFLAVGVSSRGGHFPGHRALWPTFGTAFLLAAGAGGGTWLHRRVLSNALAVGIGKISYPLYLWHWPLLSFAMLLNGEAAGGGTWLAIRLVCVALSLVLAYLTYALVERPLRFGKSGKRAVVGALAALMICIGGAGLYISLAGASGRSFISSYQTATGELRWWSAREQAVNKDESILGYVSKAEAERLHVGRYGDAGGKRTVAVVGDSHALSLFDAMREANTALGLNTLLLQYRINDQTDSEKKAALDILTGREDISDVFVVTRGTLFITGEDLDLPLRDEYKFGADYFKTWYQTLVDTLGAAGKRVWIITENPVFPLPPRAFVDRPLAFVKASPLSQDAVYAHQKAYLDALSEVRGAAIIDGLEPFFRDGVCLTLSEEGELFYSDDDHLSSVGGRHLVNTALLPCLREIAARKEGE